jgi:hypothetical protein
VAFASYRGKTRPSFAGTDLREAGLGGSVKFFGKFLAAAEMAITMSQ